jgi:hypothetical protein
MRARSRILVLTGAAAAIVTGASLASGESREAAGNADAASHCQSKCRGPRGAEGPAGPAGPRGRRGTPGPSGPAAAGPPPSLIISYLAAAGTDPHDEFLVSDVPLKLELGCSGAGSVIAVAESLADGAMATATGLSSAGSAAVRRDNSFDQGDEIDLTLGKQALATAQLVYAGPAGETLTAQYSLAGGGAVAGDRDCAVWGHYDDPDFPWG